MGTENDLSEFFDPGITLKIRGKEYYIPAASASIGLRLRQMFRLGAMTLIRENEEAMKLLGCEWVVEKETVPMFDPDTNQLLLDDDQNPVTHEVEIGAWVGGIYDQMDADGVTIDEILHAGKTALFKTVYGKEIADRHWDKDLLDEDSLEVTDSGNPEPQPSGENRAARRAAAKKVPGKKAAPKKATSSKASGGSTTRGRARTAKTTPAEPTTIP